MEVFSITAQRARRLALATVIVVLIAAALLHVFAVSPLAIWDHAQAMGLETFTVVALGWVLLVVVQSLRWHLITAHAAQVRWFDSLALRIVGNLANAVLPARGGDVLRVELLSRIGLVSRATAVGTELTDVWVDKLGWLIALLAVCAFGSPPWWMSRVVACIGALSIIAISSIALAGRFAGRWEWVDAIARGMSRSWKRTALVAGFVAPVSWLVETSVIVAASRVAGMPLGPMQAFAMLTALNLAMLVPVPANLGTTEASATAALVAFGVPLETAAGFAVVYHLGQLTPTIALGLGATALLAGRRGKDEMALAPADVLDS